MVLPFKSWREDLKGTARSWHWWRAAGFKKDGSDKSRKAHSEARLVLHRIEKLRLIDAKDVDDITPEDIEFLDKETLRVGKKNANRKKWLAKPGNVAKEAATKAKRRAKPGNAAKAAATNTEWRAKPENKVKRNAIQAKWRIGMNAKKAVSVDKFSEESGCDTRADPLTDVEAFTDVRKLIEDEDSDIGQEIFKLLGMTLKQAFWDGQGTAAMYPCASRGDASIGGSTAESINFMVGRKAPILTNGVSKTPFKSTQQNFNKLGLRYIPLYSTTSYGNCTTMESAFQLFFDFLPIGSYRLWKQSGAGNFHRPLRTNDMDYITKTGDLNPKFVFGITFISNVAVIQRGIDAEGMDIVKSISAGNGVQCDVNQPLNSKPNMTASQESARAAVYATLPPHFCN
jgi:hypothetical protein